MARAIIFFLWADAGDGPARTFGRGGKLYSNLKGVASSPPSEIERKWVIVHEFLRKTCGDAVVDDILANGRRFYSWQNAPFIPVEFSVAAFRFGHSQVRSGYRANLAGDKGEPLHSGIVQSDTGLADIPDWPGVNEWIKAVAEPMSAMIISISAVLDPQAIILGGSLPRPLAERLILHPGDPCRQRPSQRIAARAGDRTNRRSRRCSRTRRCVNSAEIAVLQLTQMNPLSTQ